MQAELTEMVGAKIYERFVALVREKERLRTKGVPLPHPAVRGRSRRNGAEASTVTSDVEGAGA
jgi:hypothetical protein